MFHLKNYIHIISPKELRRLYLYSYKFIYMCNDSNYKNRGQVCERKSRAGMVWVRERTWEKSERGKGRGKDYAITF